MVSKPKMIIMTAIPAQALDVLIVQSSKGPAYAESIRGFKEAFKGTTQTLLLTDYAEVDLVRLVKEEQPGLVLAVGEPALSKAKKVRQVPVVALMSLSHSISRPPAANIHGIPVVASPARYMQLFSAMGVKRVGVVYDPARTGYYIKRAQQMAESAGIKLVAFDVNGSREVVGAIEKINGAVDLLWMLPDTTAVTAATLEAYFGFSARHKVPVVAFNEQYLSKGAAVSIDVDRTDMGRQAGELANALLSNGDRSAATALDPRRLRLNSNYSIVEKLGLHIPDSTLFSQK